MNQAFPYLFGIPGKCLIGIGIEEFVHPDSLKTILNHDKRRRHGDQEVPDHFQAFFLKANGEKIQVNVLVCPFKRPSGTWLALIEKSENSAIQED